MLRAPVGDAVGLAVGDAVGDVVGLAAAAPEALCLEISM